MVRILVHVDDMGATPAITRRIGTAWRSGLIDGFSVIASGDGINELREILAEDPRRPARIAVHLNLSEGAPQTSPDLVPHLVDHRGVFRHDFFSLLREWTTGTFEFRRELAAQVRLEWRAQLRRVQDLVAPRVVDAVDGHIHVHMLPFLFPIAASIASECGVAAIRLTNEPLYLGTWLDFLPSKAAVNTLKHAVLRLCATLAAPHVARYRLQHPDRFIGVRYTGMMTAESARAGVLAAVAKGAESVEVLFHIGRATPDEAMRWQSNPSVGRFPLDPARDLEWRALQRFREVSRDLES